MSAPAGVARVVTCYVVGCGRCSQVYEYDDVEVHFESVDEAIERVREVGWTCPAAGGPPICPACTCAELGHVDGPVIAIRCLHVAVGHPVGCCCSTDAGVGIRGCDRCGRLERTGPDTTGATNGGRS